MSLVYDLKTNNKTIILNDTSEIEWTHYLLILMKNLNDEFVVIPTYNESDQMGYIYLYEIETANFTKIYNSTEIQADTRVGINGRYVVWAQSKFYYDLQTKKLIEVHDEVPWFYSMFNDKLVNTYDVPKEDLLGLELYDLVLGRSIKIPVSQSESYRLIFFNIYRKWRELQHLS